MTAVELRGIGWDHPRCMAPLRACAEAWAAAHPAVALAWEARPLSAFEDQPLEQLAASYDLLAIDHPSRSRAPGPAASASRWRPPTRSPAS